MFVITREQSEWTDVVAVAPDEVTAKTFIANAKREIEEMRALKAPDRGHRMGYWDMATKVAHYRQIEEDLLELYAAQKNALVIDTTITVDMAKNYLTYIYKPVRVL